MSSIIANEWKYFLACLLLYVQHHYWKLGYEKLFAGLFVFLVLEFVIWYSDFYLYFSFCLANTELSAITKKD